MTHQQQIKHTGATFTPQALGAFLANKLLAQVSTHQEMLVLDPACGEGALLTAIQQAMTHKQLSHRLLGYDSSETYLAIARKQLPSSAQLIQADFLETGIHPLDQLSLPFAPSLDVAAETPSVDMIIANPPYVRTQVLGAARAQQLAKKYNLKGRVDLYYPFLMAMTDRLKPGGLLGVITSNRYLSTKGGESIRAYLSTHYHIIELIDLGDTKLFDAAVLPAIFIGRKKARGPNGRAAAEARFTKIYEVDGPREQVSQPVDDIYEVLQTEAEGYFTVGSKTFEKTRGVLTYSAKTGQPWGLLSQEEAHWVSVIDRYAHSRVGDHFKVRVGIKTTADKVFLGDHWEAMGSDQPEAEILRDLISQENIQPWRTTSEVKLKVLYTHQQGTGKKQAIDLAAYPKAQQYLKAHYEQLAGRKYVLDAGRNWYEIWVPQQPKLWHKPKLVFPDISPIPRFYFDTEGKIVNGNCYWMVAEQEEEVDKLLLIQGIANTRLMTRYHDVVFNNKLYSGRRRYLTQYVTRYPMPDPVSETAQAIVSLVRQLNQSEAEPQRHALEAELEQQVAAAFGVESMAIMD
jgi:SAM-dependent methyltransferase